MNHLLQPPSVKNPLCRESEFSRTAWPCPSTRAGSLHGHYWWFFVRSERRSQSASEDDAAVPLRRTAKMARLEAVLFVADAAISTRRLAQLATLADASEARSLIESLNIAYGQTGCAFKIERVATGYRLLTRAEFAFWLDKLHHRQSALKLSPPAMETLAIIAYRQPIVRADVEAIRGVQCAEMLKHLMDRGLVRIAGEDDSLGRPYLYETTRRFLEIFGLQNLDDLPMSQRLRRSKPKQPTDEDAGASESQMDTAA